MGRVEDLDAKLNVAETWFADIDITDPRYNKAFEKYVTLLRERASLYVQKPAYEQTMF